MQIKYGVSLWNFYHYESVPSLERIVGLVKEQGYGIEFWDSWKEERDLYDEVGRKRLKGLVRGMEVSLHSGNVHSFAEHKKQIDAARELGAGVIVIHPCHLFLEKKAGADVKLCRDIVEYAKEKKVRLALENGDLLFLKNAIEKTDGLGICLDVGHVYLDKGSMKEYLHVLKKRLIHLHIQDILPAAEDALPNTGKDHYIPGTGGIPGKDWELLAKTLREIDFRGTAVFEIQPRNPLQTALIGTAFMRRLLRP